MKRAQYMQANNKECIKHKWKLRRNNSSGKFRNWLSQHLARQMLQLQETSSSSSSRKKRRRSRRSKRR